MLKILLIILLVAIYVAVSYWLIAKAGFNTAREYAQYLMQDADSNGDDFAYYIEALRNRYGEQGVHKFTVVYSIEIVLLVPIVEVWVAIDGLFN